MIDGILDVLRENGQISEKQYRNLKERAHEELKQQRRAPKAAPAAAPVKRQAPAARPVAAPVKTKAAPAEPIEAQVEDAKPKDDGSMRAYWKDGFRLESNDGDFKLRIGGRIQIDGGNVESSPAAQEVTDVDRNENGVIFRRARIRLQGTVYKNFDFRFEYDFAGGDPDFKDVYMEAKQVPFLQRIRVGHFKEPYSLEELTSSNDITFMERGLENVLHPERNTGIATLMSFLDQRMTAAAGAFRITNDFGDSFGGGSNYSISARATGLPWQDEDNGGLLHVGLSYNHRFQHGQTVSISQRPESRLAPNLISTGDFLIDDLDSLNPELALVLGPLSLQAEFLQTFVQTPEADDPRFFGWYGYASYLLTGESRPYKAEDGHFAAIQPKRNFGFDSDDGWGAFEVGARYSQLSLSSGGIDGGRLNATTLGLNWYLNPVIRIMLNYVYADRRPQGAENIVQTRFQLAF